MARMILRSPGFAGLLALPAALAGCAGSDSVPAAPARGGRTILAGRFLRLDYDPTRGRFDLATADGRPLLRGAAAAVVGPDVVILPPGAFLNRAGSAVLSVDARYVRSARADRSADPALPGPRLVVTLRDRAGVVDLEQRITLLSDRPGAVVELAATNVSGRDLSLRRLEPLRALGAEGGGCAFGGEGPLRLLTNGWMYYDPGRVLDFNPGGAPVDSFWDAAFHEPVSRRTLVAGFLDNDVAEGHVVAERKGGAAFDFAAQARRNDVCLLAPGKRAESGRFLLRLSDDPHSGLEDYAATMGRLHQVRLNPVLNGWCSWFVTYGDVTEEEVLKEAAFIARELKPYGMEWVQVDDGFYRAFGDWEGNAKFPRGMKGLASEIKKLGLRPGIWVAPYAISEGTALAKNHPDWLGRDAEGKVQRIVPDHQGQAQLILDVTNPGARAWVRDLFRTLTEDWGYDFVKIDFVEWTLLALGRYQDPAFSKAAAYRLGAGAMREGMGPDRHLLDCGPGPESVGLIDSMRIELDQPTPPFPVWQQYAGQYNSTGPAVSKRYYFHGRTWINDADHLRLAGLTIPQARAAATITALSGGTMISGDRLYALDPERLDILKKVLPAPGEGARPADLFERDRAELFALAMKRPFAAWTLAGIFNWGDAPTERESDLAAFGLDAGKTYLAYEFWSQKFLGETKGRLNITQEPTSAALIAFREARGIPQVLGTDRHITMGGVELADVRWDPRADTLSGTALGAPGMSWRLAIHVPPAFVPAEGPSATTGLSDVAFAAPVLRATVRFESGDRVSWAVRFR